MLESWFQVAGLSPLLAALGLAAYQDLKENQVNAVYSAFVWLFCIVAVQYQTGSPDSFYAMTVMLTAVFMLWSTVVEILIKKKGYTFLHVLQMGYGDAITFPPVLALMSPNGLSAFLILPFVIYIAHNTWEASRGKLQVPMVPALFAGFALWFIIKAAIILVK